MKEIFVTITGTYFYQGQGFFEKGMELRLIKEPENQFDKEAIRAELKGLGKVGYVANSPRTVLGESFSAGRLYDKVADEALAEVYLVLQDGVLCLLKGETVHEETH